MKVQTHEGGFTSEIRTSRSPDYAVEYDVWKDGKVFGSGYGKDRDEAQAKINTLLNPEQAPPEEVATPDESLEPSEEDMGEAVPEEESAEAPADEQVTADLEEPEEPEEPAAGPKRGKLPDGFPGKLALDGAGQGTYAKVRKLRDAGTLTDIPGIGEATAQHIIEALEGE